MSLYNTLNGMNLATFFILPMLNKHPDEYPRFRDCFTGEDNNSIVIYTRVGGGNRNCGFGEEELYKHPNFIKTYDDDFDSTYGYYAFSIPNKWEKDFAAILNGKLWSEEYHNQMCKIFPKLKDNFTQIYNKRKEELLKSL